MKIGILVTIIFLVFLEGCIIRHQSVTIDLPFHANITEKPVATGGYEHTHIGPTPTPSLMVNLNEYILSDFPRKNTLSENWMYSEGTCEKAARAFQQAYGGDLIFVQPLNTDGSYDLGDYNGIWMNYVYDSKFGMSYFIDYPNQRVFNTSEDIANWYQNTNGKKYIVYDMNRETPPFPVIYHY